MIEVEIEAAEWTKALPRAESLARRAAEAVGQVRPLSDVTILLADDEAVRALNGRFRGQDRATNVLSFPAAPSAAPHLGDIALAFGGCAGEAEARGLTLGDHLTHLVIHGVLHLLGYDHQIEADAEPMESLERDILAGLGIADPYAGGDHVEPDR